MTQTGKMTKCTIVQSLMAAVLATVMTFAAAGLVVDTIIDKGLYHTTDE